MVCSWTKPRIGLRIIHNREPELPEQIEFGIHVALILYPPMGVSPPMRGAARDYRQVGCAPRNISPLHPVDARSVFRTSLVELIRPHPCIGNAANSKITNFFIIIYCWLYGIDQKGSFRLLCDICGKIGYNLRFATKTGTLLQGSRIITY